MLERRHESHIQAQERHSTFLLIDSGRILLAGAALLGYATDVPGVVRSLNLTISLLAIYFFYALFPFVFGKRTWIIFRTRAAIWIDVSWYITLIIATDPLTTVLYQFFPFVILVSSFVYGCREGRRITCCATGGYFATGIATACVTPEFEWGWLCLRTVFLLALGLTIAYWGGSEVTFKRRLALLREVNELSNPRFGPDQSINSIMEKLRAFFGAQACLLVFEETASDNFAIRQVSLRSNIEALRKQPLAKNLARVLLSFQTAHVVLYEGAQLFRRHKETQCRLYDISSQEWKTTSNEDAESVASLLNAKCYIGVPIEMAGTSGRIYISKETHRFSMDEALFMTQAVEQAFRLVEHVELLDRLVSGAAGQERERIIGNLHDTAIQPYIGLKLGLEALRVQAERENALLKPIDNLIKMTTEVISDLRIFVAGLKSDVEVSSENLLANGIKRQAAHSEEYFGIRINVDVKGDIAVNDRLAAEVLQIVNEGVSNIRRHTTARHGTIRLCIANGNMLLDMENDISHSPPAPFVPHSIAKRVKSLGGSIRVSRNINNKTLVEVRIPI